MRAEIQERACLTTSPPKYRPNFWEPRRPPHGEGSSLLGDVQVNIAFSVAAVLVDAWVMLRNAIVRPQLSNLSTLWTAKCFATRRGETDEAELAAARKWLANLDADTIRDRAACEISFSRSSGPGGQNVNK